MDKKRENGGINGKRSTVKSNVPYMWTNNFVQRLDTKCGGFVGTRAIRLTTAGLSPLNEHYVRGYANPI